MLSAFLILKYVYCQFIGAGGTFKEKTLQVYHHQAQGIRIGVKLEKEEFGVSFMLRISMFVILLGTKSLKM